MWLSSAGLVCGMAMETELWAVAAGILSSLMAAAATFFLKRGGAETRLSLRRFYVDRRVFGAILLYLLSSLFFIIALRGAQLSVLLPLGTLEYVWILVFAKKFLREEIGLAKGFGVGCIVLGLFLVGLGS